MNVKVSLGLRSIEIKVDNRQDANLLIDVTVPEKITEKNIIQKFFTA
jgi:hypothetical protein